MRLYTIQHQNAWTSAQTSGFLSGNCDFIEPDFIKAYRWMMEEMSKRLKGFEGEYPVWLWNRKPDLRNTGYLNRGTTGVLLEIVLQKYEVLFSDFMAWHIVLTNGFLALTEDEDNLFERQCSSVTKEESWKRIFDYEGLRKSDYWKGSNELQGVTGKIPLEKITLLKTFIAR